MRSALIILAFVLLSTCAWAASPQGSPDIIFPGKLGKVYFSHAKHQQTLKIPCLTCHHVGMDIPRCSACHGTKGDVIVIKDAFHKLCRGCHIEKGSGPTECKGCHRKKK